MTADFSEALDNALHVFDIADLAGVTVVRDDGAKLGGGVVAVFRVTRIMGPTTLLGARVVHNKIPRRRAADVVLQFEAGPVVSVVVRCR